MKYLKISLMIIFLSLFAYQEIRIRKFEQFTQEFVNDNNYDDSWSGMMWESFFGFQLNVKEWADRITEWQGKVDKRDIYTTKKFNEMTKTVNWLLDRERKK